MKNKEQFAALVANVNPRARLPIGFSLWSRVMQLAWLKQHQKKGARGARRKV